MTPTPVTKTFTITTSPDVMKRFERFLALLHWNSRFGHSSIFAMPLDGDGWDKVTISPEPQHAKEVNLIGGVGFDVELARDGSYGGKFIQQRTATYWVKDNRLYRQRVNEEPEIVKDRSES